MALLLSGTWVQAQTYSNDWVAISSGGGRSTRGSFAVTGTIGQPASNPPALIGGNLTVQAGFWSLFAIQTAGAPFLNLTRDLQSPVVTVSWPSPSTGFVLQQTTDLIGPNWIPVPHPVIDNGRTKSVVVNPLVGTRYYRLFKP
jgi:hypothetical protein